MIKDFKGWYVENAWLLDHLREHDSILFAYIKHTLDSLLFISELKEDEIDDDLSGIFDAGYSYIYYYVDQLKLYLENTFNKDFHLFLKYDSFIQYMIYMNEIKGILIDEVRYNGVIKEEFDYVLNGLDDVINNHKEPNHEILDDFDLRIMSVISSDTIETIPEVFVKVYDTLKI